MNSMSFASFESLVTTGGPIFLGSFTGIQCVSKVLNLFDTLVNQHYRFSHGFDVLRKFQSMFKLLVDHHSKVLSQEFNVI